MPATTTPLSQVRSAPDKTTERPLPAARAEDGPRLAPPKSEQEALLAYASFVSDQQAKYCQE